MTDIAFLGAPVARSSVGTTLTSPCRKIDLPSSAVVVAGSQEVIQRPLASTAVACAVVLAVAAKGGRRSKRHARSSRCAVRAAKTERERFADDVATQASEAGSELTSKILYPFEAAAEYIPFAAERAATGVVEKVSAPFVAIAALPGQAQIAAEATGEAAQGVARGAERLAAVPGAFAAKVENTANTVQATAAGTGENLSNLANLSSIPGHFVARVEKTTRAVGGVVNGVSGAVGAVVSAAEGTANFIGWAAAGGPFGGGKDTMAESPASSSPVAPVAAATVAFDDSAAPAVAPVVAKSNGMNVSEKDVPVVAKLKEGTWSAPIAFSAEYGDGISKSLLRNPTQNDTILTADNKQMTCEELKALQGSQLEAVFPIKVMLQESKAKEGKD